MRKIKEVTLPNWEKRIFISLNNRTMNAIREYSNLYKEVTLPNWEKRIFRPLNNRTMNAIREYNLNLLKNIEKK